MNAISFHVNEVQDAENEIFKPRVRNYDPFLVTFFGAVN